MFFVLSKILDVLLTPLAWATVLIAVGITGRGASPRRTRRALAALGLAILLVFSLEPVSNALIGGLERDARRTLRPGVIYDAVILLGGVTEGRAEATWGERSFNNSNERLLETFDLLRTGTARNAILSGGTTHAARGAYSEAVEADSLADQLAAWGIARDRLVIEDAARNTHENATLSAAIVRARGWKSVLVVTSAFHMYRAAGCYRAEGLAVDTLPVDFRSFGGEYAVDTFPRARYLEVSTTAVREWVGRRVYELRGYSR